MWQYEKWIKTSLRKIRSVIENFVADEKGERNFVTERTVTSDRKRKCSDGDYDVSVDCHGNVNRCSLSRAVGFNVERLMAVDEPPAAFTAILGTLWSPPTNRHITTTHDETQAPVRRPPTHRANPDNDYKLSSLPLDVVDSWHKNWMTSASASRFIVEPTLCRESVLPVLLLSSSSFCQLSN